MAGKGSGVAVDEAAVHRFVSLLHERVAAATSGMSLVSPILNLCAIVPDGRSKPVISRYLLGDCERMAADAITEASAGRNIYIEGRILFGDRVTGRERGKLRHTQCVFALVVDRDADRGNSGHRLNDTTPLIVETSPGNTHDWHFFNTALSPEDAYSLGARLKAAAGADSGTGDIVHCFRLPGTPNFPDPGKTARGRIPVRTRMLTEGQPITRTAFEAALPLPEPPKPKRIRKPSLVERKSKKPPSVVVRKLAAKTRDRSVQFQSAVAAAIASGMEPEEFEALARQNATGCASKYLTDGSDRLKAEIERSWEKAEQLPPQEEEGNEARGSKWKWREHDDDAARLLAMKFKPLRFLAPGLIPSEGVTLICSKPKGHKSFLLVDLALSATANQPVLGNMQLPQGSVLLLALEDSKRRVQDRMKRMLPMFGNVKPQGLSVFIEWQRVDAGGLDDMREWITRERTEGRTPLMIMVDVLQMVRPQPSAKKPAYTIDYEAVVGLRNLARDEHIAIVVAHHLRKAAADDPFDRVSGTYGLVGAADTVIVIEDTPNGKVFDVRGRDVENATLAVEFNKVNCRWRLLGDACVVHRGRTQAAILAELTDEPMTAAEITDAIATTDATNNAQNDRTFTPLSQIAVRRMLQRMAKKGEIHSLGRNKFVKIG
jgi:hypothetical protein